MGGWRAVGPTPASASQVSTFVGCGRKRKQECLRHLRHSHSWLCSHCHGWPRASKIYNLQGLTLASALAGASPGPTKRVGLRPHRTSCRSTVIKCPTLRRSFSPRFVCFHTHTGFERNFFNSYAVRWPFDDLGALAARHDRRRLEVLILDIRETFHSQARTSTASMRTMLGFVKYKMRRERIMNSEL